MAEQPPHKQSTADTFRTLGPLMSVGLSVVLAIVIGVGAGLTLDRWLGTSPWFFFLFFILGVTAAILNVYRAVGKS
jgi:ATP synthase protein I